MATETSAAKLISRDRITDAAATLFSATDDSGQIPEMFVRNRADELEVAGEDEAFELPVVDMAKLLDPELSASETAKLGSACRDWGFFHVRAVVSLTSHGVDEEVMRHMKGSTAEFFRLPLETKNAIAFGGDDTFNGFGHHFNRGPSVGNKLDWAECVLLAAQPGRASLEITDLTRRVLGFMAADLGVSEEALVGAFFSISGDVKGQSVGIHHYPHCRQPEKVLGISPHTDWPGLTVLLHAVDTPGLQVRRGRRWLPVRPLPGALVVNVGDILHVLTNGEYMSAEHRVVPDAERCRITVAISSRETKGGHGGKHDYSKGNFVALADGARFLDSLKK
ncbi:hypothetical protein HU200_034990 [Digitaria exilis]|uniref:Fe2OG dioxygenase domain-containing protein n=1 Tax=Digitaria exilis TaxID=1010633 RepID=A0A835ENC9_9POAL|nr:hypothetical protein HU200_034990 [Digitaria exilis]